MNWIIKLVIATLSLVIFEIFLMRRGENDVLEVMKRNGYEGELHHVTTEDKYILGIQRITKGSDPKNNGKDKKKQNIFNSSNIRLPVLIIHGLESSAIDWIYFQGKNSLPYLLYEEGYDVWLGNCRGAFSSYNHSSLDPHKDSKKFFNSSIHHIGFYDLPAMIDYILHITTAKKLFYIGMSQGEASYLILTSTRPEYNGKIQLASLVAASSHLSHSDNTIMKSLGRFWKNIQTYSSFFKIYEMPARDKLGLVCRLYVFSSACKYIISSFIGYTNFDQLDDEKITELFTIYPTKSSVKQLLHYLQFYNTGKFCNFDYGEEGNLREYGTLEPPEYDLHKISSPVAYYTGQNDCWSRPKDVEYIVTSLSNVVLNYVVSDKMFSHIDFLLARDVKSLLYDKIIETMSKHS